MTDSGAGPEPGGSGPEGDVTGELPAGWVRATLGELGVEAQPGFASGKHNRDGEGILHLRPMNITRNGALDTLDARYVVDESDRRVELGDVLFNNTNSPALVGKTAWVDSAEPLAFSNHMTRLRGPKELDGNFLATQLHHMWATGYFKSILNNHVNQASVSRKALLDTVIVVPPLAEQYRIVAKLVNQMAHVEAGARSIRYALQNAEQLPTSIVDSLVEELKAEGVPVKPLSSLLGEPLRNGISAKATRSGSGIRTLTLTAVTRDKFIDQYTKMTEADPRKAEKLWLRDGDIFVQRSNSAELVGTSAIYRGGDRWAIYPDLLIRVRVDSQRVAAGYVALVLRTSEVRHRFRQSARGLSGSMPKIDQSVIEGVPVPVPSLERQREIVEQVQKREATLSPLVDSIRATEGEGESLRAALLHAAFTGTLVPQNPDDEPASVLLDRIRAQRSGGAMPAKRKRAPRTTSPAARQTSGRPVPSGTQEALPL